MVSALCLLAEKVLLQAGVLIGFATEGDWFDYKLEHDPRFLARVAAARKSLREGKGIRIKTLRK